MPGGNYRKNISILVFFASMILCAASALAEEISPVGSDTFKLTVGGFLPSIDSQLKINSKIVGGGTGVDLESDIGFDEDVNLGRIEGYWRFAKKHRLFIGYYGFDRDAHHTLEKDIIINDKLFEVGASLSSNWEIDFIYATYAYSFFQGENGSYQVLWDSTTWIQL